MRQAEIEAWALDVIERVRLRQPVEDTRVEIKAQWPAPNGIARRIAGHMNAARGSPVLWLIGLDEKEGVVGTTQEELANWLPQMQAQFDGLSPALTDLNIPTREGTVVALLFQTERPPYVVKGRDKPDLLEVPWREGTRTRSATREELLRMLWRLHVNPEFELLHARLTVNPYEEDGAPRIRWDFDAGFYVVPQPEQTTVLPFHKCSAALTIPSVPLSRDFDRVTLRGADPSSRLYAPAGWSEVRILAPGRVIVACSAVDEGETMPYGAPAIVDLRLMPVAGDVPVTLQVCFNSVVNESTEEKRLFRWSL